MKKYFNSLLDNKPTNVQENGNSYYLLNCLTVLSCRSGTLKEETCQLVKANCFGQGKRKCTPMKQLTFYPYAGVKK